MNVVDSSGWIEYAMGTVIGSQMRTAVEFPKTLVVPTITIYEVYKKLSAEMGKNAADRVVAYMEKGNVIGLDKELALFAVKMSQHYKLALADSIIYAVAQQQNAILWTADKHFDGLPNVRYFVKIHRSPPNETL